MSGLLSDTHHWFCTSRSLRSQVLCNVACAIRSSVFPLHHMSAIRCCYTYWLFINQPNGYLFVWCKHTYTNTCTHSYINVSADHSCGFIEIVSICFLPREAITMLLTVKCWTDKTVFLWAGVLVSSVVMPQFTRCLPQAVPTRMALALDRWNFWHITHPRTLYRVLSDIYYMIVCWCTLTLFALKLAPHSSFVEEVKVIKSEKYYF